MLFICLDLSLRSQKVSSVWNDEILDKARERPKGCYLTLVRVVSKNRVVP